MNTPAVAAPATAKREALVLAAILLMAAGLRLVRLDVVPPGLYVDEVAMSVNARLLGTTGRSLKGDRFPLYVHEATFERYGVPRIIYQPVFQYAMVPFASLFGCSPWTIRLPSVLFGLAGILGAYFLGRQLFEHSTLPLLAAASLAVSPWHHHFSRIGFEAISLLPFVCFGLGLVLRGLKGGRGLVGGAAVLAAGTYAYPTARLFVPLLMLGVAVLYYPRLRERWKEALVAVAVAAVVAAPNLVLILSDPNQQRMKDLLIWSGSIDSEPAVQSLRGSGGAAEAILSRRPLLIAYVFGYNYLHLVSPVFLFLAGDTNPRHAFPGAGMLTISMLPLVATGLLTWIRGIRGREQRLLLWWFVLWPIPSSLTTESPHAIRALVALPLLDYAAAVGLLELFQHGGPAALRAQRFAWKSGLASVLLWFALLRGPYDLASYLWSYHRDYPALSAAAWNAGQAQAFRLLRDQRREAEPLFISSRVENAWLNALFHLGTEHLRTLPPSEWREHPLPDGVQVVGPASKDPTPPRGLGVITAKESPAFPGATIVGEIPYADGTPNLIVVRIGDRR